MTIVIYNDIKYEELDTLEIDDTDDFEVGIYYEIMEHKSKLSKYRKGTNGHVLNLYMLFGKKDALSLYRKVKSGQKAVYR